MATKSKSRNKRKQEILRGDDLLSLELQAIHNAETQLSKVLPKFSKVIESDTLRELMDERLSESERIIRDIEAVFDDLDESPKRKTNLAAEGLINDAREHIEEIEAGPALDAVLIASMQKTEHYCIAAWGTAKSLGRATEQQKAVKSMERALQEGGKFDQKLTGLAEKEVTPALLAQESGEESDEESEEDE